MIRNFRRIFIVCCLPFAFCGGAHAASNEFQAAAQLLAAARAGNTAQMQTLINMGANVNFVDRTGLSIVCTAIMNRDMQAAQLLQMYGADASRCDQQIRRFQQSQPRQASDGLLSGLSSPQVMALTIGGAAVAVATVWYVSGLMGVRGSNRNPGIGNGNRPNTGGNNNPGGGSSSAWTLGPLPFGPAQAFGSSYLDPSSGPNFGTGTSWDYAGAQNYLVRDGITPLSINGFDDFRLLSFSPLPMGIPLQNYLLMMRGYGTLARGYLGMTTLRQVNAPYAPLQPNISNNGPADFDTFPLGGGKPITIALISAHGINADARAFGDITPVAIEDPTTGGGSSIEDGWLYWASSPGNVSWRTTSRRLYNNKIIRGPDTTTTDDDDAIEDPGFDFTGSGTAIYNRNATWYDNLLAKIIIGGTSTNGRASPDFTGFLPNGQLVVYRTGGGQAFTVDGALTGDTATAFNTTMTAITINGTLYDAEFDSATRTFTFTATGYPTLTGTVMPDGTLFVGVGSGITNVYSINSSNAIVLAGTWGASNYQNYRAILSAIGALNDGLVDTTPPPGSNNDLGRTAQVSVIANASPIKAMYATDTKTITDVLAFPNTRPNPQTATERQNAFTNWINDYYNVAGDAVPQAANDADLFFTLLGTPQYRQITIFSTGGYFLGTATDLNNPSFSPGRTQEAVFENAAPLVYDRLQHLFMSAVAVQLIGGTPDTSTNVATWNPNPNPNTNAGKITLSTWVDPYSDPNDPDREFYRARMCGVAGLGSSTVDPWCFAAAGITDQMAVASLAGAVGVMQSAFGSYMSNDQIFVLMALTADGRAPLGSTPAATLAILQDRYLLPPEFQFEVDNGLKTYMQAFAEVFGYGLVNLDRATRPGTTVNYYTVNKINSPSGNAFWRASSSSGLAGMTGMSLTGAFGARSASIKIPVFDFVKSADGEMSMPRIFDYSVSMSAGRRGMWLGDALGEFKTEDREHITGGGDGVPLTASMSLRESFVDDGYGNIDKLKLRYGAGAWMFGAKYERNMGDTNILRGDNANPILAIASHAMSTDAAFHSGNWRFGIGGFTGSITEEGLLANDPALSGNRELMKLGAVWGFDTGAVYDAGIFSVASSFGFMNESDTMLGAYSAGLLSLGGANTMYLDNTLTIRAGEKLRFNARYTAARTDAGFSGGVDTIIAGLSELQSNAMSVGAEYAGFMLSVSQPLVVTRGTMQYVTADHELIETIGGFELSSNPYIADFDLSPARRETRVSAAYRTALGEFTSGALGFVYRINPNHTTDFGNETLLMLKLNHRLGI